MNLYDSIVYEAIAGSGGGGGGGSSYELLAKEEFEVSTTSTSNITVDRVNIAPADSALRTDKIIYVRIYDKAGNRKGYFCENHKFFYYFGGTVLYIGGIMTRAASGTMNVSTSATYGVYADSLVDNSGMKAVQIKARYSSSSSLTIDGTYVVEVYYLDYSNNISPYDRQVE